MIKGIVCELIACLLVDWQGNYSTCIEVLMFGQSVMRAVFPCGSVLLALLSFGANEPEVRLRTCFELQYLGKTMGSWRWPCR